MYWMASNTPYFLSPSPFRPHDVAHCNDHVIQLWSNYFHHQIAVGDDTTGILAPFFSSTTTMSPHRFFGFSFNKAGLTRYNKLVNVFRFTDLTVLKFMMTPSS